MDESTATVRLPEAAPRRFGHVCGFFRSQDEEYRVLLPLAKEGFAPEQHLFVRTADLRYFGQAFEVRVAAPDGAVDQAVLDEVATRFGMRYRLLYASRPKRVAIFVSKYDHCLYDLLLRHQAGELPCELALVLSNHPDLEKVAKTFGVPFHLSAKDGENKVEQEQRELALLDEQNIDLVVLARYMQVLSDGLSKTLRGRAINIHHSFLPGFKGAKPYHQAYDRGVKLIGATAHYVTADLDEGPIIEQRVTRADHAMSAKELVDEGSNVESQVLAAAVKWWSEKRVFLNGTKTVVFN